MDYSIIIPAYNEACELPATLESIRQAQKPCGAWAGEVIVVNNASTDATAAIAEAAGVRVVFEEEHKISRVRNTGARAAGGKYLVFLDADTVMESGLLAEVLEALDSGTVCGGGSAVLYKDNPGGFAEHLLFSFHSKELAVGDVIQDVAALVVLDVNIVGEVVDEAAEKVSFGGQFVLDLLQGSNISGDTEVADDLASPVAQGHLGSEGPGDAAEPSSGAGPELQRFGGHVRCQSIPGPALSHRAPDGRRSVVALRRRGDSAGPGHDEGGHPLTEP